MRLVYEHLTDIPQNFTEVEYLESSGAQYIDTGYKFTSNMRFKINHIPTGSISDNYFTGHYATNNKIFVGGFYQNKCIWGIGQLQENTINASANQRFIVDITYTSNSSANTSSISGTINGQSVSLTSTALQNFVYGLNILAFARNNNGSVGHYLSCKLYSFQIYNSDTLVRDFVPCLDNNNVPCMYDKVEGKAYYNAGTGSFTYGRKIIPVEYLESSGTQYINTGVNANSNPKYELKFVISYTNPSSPSPQYTGADYGGTFGVVNGNWQWSNNVPVTANQFYEIDYINQNGSRGVYVNGTDYYQGNNYASFGYRCLLFAAGQDSSGTTKTNLFSAKMKSCSIALSDTVVRDFVPCKDENNVGFMFDRVTHTAYLNAGTGSFTFGKTLPKKKLRLIRESKRRLPKGFKEVEYLQSSGTQWIDTGFIPTENTRTVAGLYTTSTANKNWFGANGESQVAKGCYCFNAFSATQVEYLFGNVRWERANYVAVNKVFTVDFSKNGIYIDNVLVATPSYTDFGTGDRTMTLFVRKGGTAYISGRIYFLQMYDNGTLVRDFIPCLDNNNTPCMYDLVGQKAYYNAGTGSFTYGHTITPVEYLESTGTQYIDTNYAFTDNFAWEITFDGIQDNTTLFGGRTSSARTALLYQRVEGAFVTTCPIAGLNGAATPFQLSDLRTGRHTVKMAVNENKGSVWEDGVQLYNETSFTGTYISGTTQALFADKFGTNDYREQTSSKVYGLKMWQGPSLVRDYIPVKDENNVGYMFDKVNHTLYNNSGTGSFTVGSELKDKIRFLRGK